VPEALGTVMRIPIGILGWDESLKIGIEAAQHLSMSGLEGSL
jgi:hypothetical protein